MRGGWRQRRRLGLPDAWREITATRVALWSALDDADRLYLGELMDDLIVGNPPLPDPAARDRWIEVCTAEYELLRAGGGGDLLSDYAAVNPGEFFAVATEVFFGLPGEMRDQKPALYGVLREFYRQDPATRWGR